MRVMTGFVPGVANVNESLEEGEFSTSPGPYEKVFGTSPQFWSNLQTNHDLAKAKPSRHVAKIKHAG
jgi:hypothetical protein